MGREGAIPNPTIGNVQKGTVDVDEAVRGGIFRENANGKTAKESLRNQ